jgi:outer membrane protein assembly factor BamB
VKLRPVRLVLASLTVVALIGGGGAPAAEAAHHHKPSLTWPTFGRTQQRSFHGATTLTQADAPMLQETWFVPADDAVTATPIVANGTVYVGSWDGVFRAVSLATGKLRWKFKVKPQPAVKPVPGDRQPQDVASDGGIITSSAAYVPKSAAHPALVIFGGGYTLYALRAGTGKLYWQHDYTGAPKRKPNPSKDPTRIFSSPAVVGSQVLFGTTNDGEDGYHGYFASADLRTGKPQWVFETDVDADGRIANNGCNGVWASPTIDKRHGLVFFDTADCDATDRMPYAEKVIALRYRSGKLAWVFKPPRKDPGCDWDFGATANLRYGKKGKPSFLGVGGKDGTYYSIAPATGKLRWQKNVVHGGTSGGFIATAAVDGKRVYGATGIGELGGAPCDPSNPNDTQIQDPSMHSFDTKTGEIVWQVQQSQAFGATTVAGGMTFVCTAFSQQLQIRDAATGTLVFTVPLQSGCNSGVVVAGNMLIFGEGTAENTQRPGFALYTPGGAAPTP